MCNPACQELLQGTGQPAMSDLWLKLESAMVFVSVTGRRYAPETPEPDGSAPDEPEPGEPEPGEPEPVA